MYLEPDEHHSVSPYIAVADISAPSEIEIIDEIRVYSLEDHMKIRGNLLYMGSSMLNIFTFRADDGLELVETQDLGIQPWLFDISDDKLFTYNFDFLAIYGLDNPLEAELLGHIENGVSDGIVSVQDEYIYVGGESIQIYRFEELAVNEDQAPVLSEFSLHPAYPNPFNAQTTIRYNITQKGSVKLGIYDLSGREVWEQTNVRQSGSHEVTFDATNLPSGVYIARLESGGVSAQQKLLLVK